MAITFFGAASVPTDPGTNTQNVTSITPPANMQEGDLVLLHTHARVGSLDIQVTGTGGQTWHALPSIGGSHTAKTFWCRFNGTWDADPAVTFNSTTCNTVVMHVFRPSNGANTWVVDVEQNEQSISPPMSAPFTATITGVTTTAESTVTIARWTTIDDNEWGNLSGTGWEVTGSNQYRNTSGNDQSESFAHKIMTSAGPTGDVTKEQTANGRDVGNATIVSFAEVEPEPPASITYVGSASVPATATGGTNTNNPTSISPVAGLQAGDLVLVTVYVRSGTVDISMLDDGGQDWTATTEDGTSKQMRLYWCRFNGTWSGNPSFQHTGSSVAVIVAMHAFRPIDSASTWEVDVPEGWNHPAAPSGPPYVVPITGQTTTAQHTVSLAWWATLDDNQWGNLAGDGWEVTHFTQVISGNNASNTWAHKIQTAAGPTGDVSKEQTALGPESSSTFIITFKEVSAGGGGIIHEGDVSEVITLGDSGSAGGSTYEGGSAESLSVSDSTDGVIEGETGGGGEITFRGVGNYDVIAFGDVSPSIPAGVQPGDMMICFWGSKAHDSTVDTPAGWTLIGAYANSPTVSPNVDVGTMVIYAFYKIADSNESPPVLVGHNNRVSAAVIIAFQNDGSAWDTPVGAGGGDSTPTTSYAQKAISEVGAQAGDMLVGYLCTPSDEVTQSGISITAPGATIDPVTESPANDLTSALSSDMSMSGGYAKVSAGSATDALTYNATLSNASYGPSFVVRLRTVGTQTTHEGAINETIALGDSRTTIKELNVSLNQPLFLFDEYLRGGVIESDLNVAVGLSDSGSRQSELDSLFESIATIVDQISAGHSANAQIDSLIQLATEVIGGGVFLDTLGETLSVSEGLAALTEWATSLNEFVQFAMTIAPGGDQSTELEEALFFVSSFSSAIFRAESPAAEEGNLCIRGAVDTDILCVHALVDEGDLRGVATLIIDEQPLLTQLGEVSGEVIPPQIFRADTTILLASNFVFSADYHK